MRIRTLGLLAVLSLASAAPAAAQIGTSTDIITGIITDTLGHPIEDAVIEVFSLETQITRTARTNQRGR